jgi:CheY-like chemotaxis protein
LRHDALQTGDQVRQVSAEILAGAGYRLLVACDAAQALTRAKPSASKALTRRLSA